MIKNIFMVLFLSVFLNGCLKTINLPKNLFTRKQASPPICDEVKVVANPFYPPFSIINENDEYVGFGIDLTNYIFDNINVKIKFIKTTSWRESVNMILNSDADLIIGAYHDPEASFLHYIEPSIANDEPMVLFKKGFLSRWEKLPNHNGQNLYAAFSLNSNCQNLSASISKELTSLQETNKLNDFILKSINIDKVQDIKPDKNQQILEKHDENEKNAVVKPINILNF